MINSLTDRRSSICVDCHDCTSGKGCRFVKKALKKKTQKYQKLPEDIKFTTDIRRCQAKARYVDINGLKGNCARCGKFGRLVRHHPDYQDCYLIEYLCYGCHRKEHINTSGDGKSKKKLPIPARQRRINKIALHYGPTCALILEQGRISNASSLAKKMGISRERVRQFIVELHGKYNKEPKKIKPRPKALSKHQWLIDKLKHHKIIVEKVGSIYIAIASGKTFKMRRVLDKRGTANHSIVHNGAVVDFVLAIREPRNIYVIPWGTFKYFSKMEDIEEYKDKFEYLLNVPAKQYTTSERISAKARERRDKRLADALDVHPSYFLD